MFLFLLSLCHLSPSLLSPSLLFLLLLQTATVTVFTKADRQVSSIAQSTMCSPDTMKARTKVALNASESFRPQPLTPPVAAPSADGDSSIDRTPPENAFRTQPTRIISAEMWKVEASVDPCANPASLEPEAVDLSRTASDQAKLATRTIMDKTKAARTALKALPGGKESAVGGLGCLRSQSTFLVVTIARRM